MIFLPFADDIHTVDAHVGPTASDEQVDKMKEIVHKLPFKYRCVFVCFLFFCRFCTMHSSIMGF